MSTSNFLYIIFTYNPCYDPYYSPYQNIYRIYSTKEKAIEKLYAESKTQERMVDFLETQIFPKYKDHLIILDNAKSHNNQMVKDAITKSGNKYLFSIPYTPMTNSPIENYFNQIKTYIKKKRNVYSFE